MGSSVWRSTPCFCLSVDPFSGFESGDDGEVLVLRSDHDTLTFSQRIDGFRCEAEDGGLRRWAVSYGQGALIFFQVVEELSQTLASAAESTSTSSGSASRSEARSPLPPF